MKLYLFLLTFVFLFSCKMENKKVYVIKSEENGLYYSFPKTYEKVYGNVKSITESTYSLWESKTTAGDIKEVLECKTLYSYDNQGNEMKISCYDDNNNLRWRTVNKYNSNGLLSKVKYYNDENHLRHIFTYSYDDKESLISTIDVDQDNPDVVFKSFQTTRNGITEERTINYKDEVIHKSTIRYDDNKNVIELCLFQPDNILIAKNTYLYDDSSRLTEVRYNEKNINNRSVYQYYDPDNLGNWQVKFCNERDSISKITRRKIEYY